MTRTRPAVALLALTAMLGTAVGAAAQQQPATTATQPQNPQTTGTASPPKTLDDTLEAGDDELPTPARNLVNFNEYNGELITLRLGAGLLIDRAGYSQDEASKEQFALFPETRLRDARILFRGGFKFERPVTWSVGILYDAVTQRYLTRQTGVMVAVPEISGYIFFGRQKEGISLNKVMVGYAGWTMERTEISDATLPILADGIKWLGYAPKKHLIWNVGFFNDAVSEGQTFSSYGYQTVGRFAWLPIENDTTVLHAGVSLRYGKVNDGVLQLRSRPEAFPAPYFVDTGKFPADSTKMTEFEFYYRPGPLLIGSEYFLQWTDAPEVSNPFFHGGNIVVSWLPTGEIRAYNTRGGYFDEISPLRTAFGGGPGAWELVGNFSYVDLDDGVIQGGKFWRFTPMVNWHLSDNARLEIAYGFGSLNRFGLVGHTQFFQSRLQLVL